MATESSIGALEAAAAQRADLVRSKVLADYWALTKPEVNFLIVITTFAGFCLARPVMSYDFPLTLLMHTLAGTLLVASGAGALNQFMERRFDAQMRRTARRREYARKYARGACVVELPIFVHASQKKNSALYAGRRLSRSHAATDRMGCSIGEVEPGGVGALRHALRLAVPALHGHCMVVPRGLRPGGLPGSSLWAAKNSFHGLAERAPGPCFDPSQSYPRAPGQCRSCLHGGSFATGLVFFLLRRTIGLSPFERCRASPALCVDHLPSIRVCSNGA